VQHRRQSPEKIDGMTSIAFAPTSTDAWAASHHPHWRQFSARLRAWTADVTGLDTVRVTITPHAPAKPPAGVFNHVTKAITLDADQTLVGRPNPAAIDLRDGRDRARHPVLCGVLAHEAGHAAHTVMRPDLTGPVATWAAVLEEPRMEGCVIADQPEARNWLRASVAHILGTPDPVDSQSAARMLALLGGRVLAGVLDDTDLPDLDDLVAPHLTPAQVAVIGDAIVTAVGLDDGDIAGLQRCAQRIVDALCADEDDTDTGADDDQSGGSSGQPSDGQAGDPSDDSGNPGHAGVESDAPTSPAGQDLEKALSQVAADAQAAMKAAAGVTSGPTPAQQLRRAEAKARAEQVAGEFRDASAGRHPSRQRSPQPQEVAAARALTRKLADAQLRETIVTSVAAVRPPGRFRAGEVVRRDAQVTAGVRPTAAPWVATRRRSSDKPPLVLGIALDVSASMHPYAGPTAVAAWAFTRAVRTLGGKVSTAVWNNSVSLIAAGESTQIREAAIGGGSYGLPAAVRVLARDLHLDQAVGARVLAVVTDGQLPNGDEIRAEIGALVAAGVRVVWLVAPGGAAMTPPDGVQVAVLDDPARIGAVIGDAAVAALR
jgi:hypothetical protein